MEGGSRYLLTGMAQSQHMGQQLADNQYVRIVPAYGVLCARRAARSIVIDLFC